MKPDYKRIDTGGTTDDIFSNPIHPYTRSLLSATILKKYRGVAII